MLDDADTPESPGWWLLRLGKKLANDQPRFDRLERYWRGDPPVPHGNKKMREAYRRLQTMARTNFGNLIVETVLERMKIVAFRSGASGTDGVDRQAWGWWQANCLDADSGLVHRASVTMSRAYVLVGTDPDTGQPVVTGEDPRQVIHESSPLNRRKVIAAVKTYWDDVAGAHRAVLYLPATVHYFISDNLSKDASSDQLWAVTSWQVDTSDTFPDGFGTNPFDEVPVVPFINRPDLAGRGMGEFEDVLDVLDRINNVILDRLVISAMQAYRQRYATGVDPVDDKGAVQNLWDPGADLIWTTGAPDAKFGEFSPTDITPIIKAIESDVQYLAAISRTPPHYLLAAIVNASGDALATAETGLVSKLLERETEYGESWEKVYRLAGKALGVVVPDDAEVVWKDPQFRTLSEMAAAAVQLMTAGVPWRTRMALLAFTPSQIQRLESERAADALLSASLASLSVAEGGEIGSRGVQFKAGPIDQAPPAGDIGGPDAGSPAGQ